ncbi:MAG: hypothetical protein ABWY54_02965 [Glaciihabitans sp.]
MSTFKNPVGPQPSKVYWRRRLIVGLGLVAVIAVIILLFVRPGADQTAPDTTGAVTATDDPAADTEAEEDTDAGTDPVATPAPETSTADGTCDESDITVEAKTDATTYAAGVNPMLSLSVTNTGEEACTMSVGTDVQEYRITSGEELIWSSKDCQESPVALEQELAPGTPVDSTPFSWDRTRSDAAACDAERTPVTGEGASYHLSVIIDGIESADTKQFVLN